MAMPLLAALGEAVCEALFFALVAAWWLLCVQWDVVDRMLGGPDLNARHSGSKRERAVEAAGLEAALSWSAGRKPSGREKAPQGPTAEEEAARAASPVDAGASSQTQPENTVYDAAAAAAAAAEAYAEADAAAPAEADGSTPSRAPQLRRRTAVLSRFGSRGSVSTEVDGDGDSRTLYGRLRRKLPAKDRLNIKQRVENRIAAYGVQLLPEFAASIGVEAAAGTLAAALPGGIRDAGVRMVDRTEALLRRWAMFAGGAAVLFRLLLWH